MKRRDILKSALALPVIAGVVTKVIGTQYGFEDLVNVRSVEWTDKEKGNWYVVSEDPTKPISFTYIHNYKKERFQFGDSLHHADKYNEGMFILFDIGKPKNKNT